MTITQGQMIGPYRVISQIGTGGMATIYKAYHERLDRDVAIKIMHQVFLANPNFRARFEREAQIVARLEHPYIVPIYDYSEFNDQPYLVMKFIEGDTLKGRLEKATGVLPSAEIIHILSEVAGALDYAHAQGVLHRDIKPSNILLDQQGQAYITDFGLARMRQVGETTLSADVLLGTPFYISPEQAQGKTDLTHHTDLYSLGVVMYQMVVGRVPFSSDTPYAVIHDHIYTPLPSASQMNPAISKNVEAVLNKALAKAPEDRFNTALEMVQALSAALQGQAPVQPKESHIEDFEGTILLTDPFDLVKEKPSSENSFTFQAERRSEIDAPRPPTRKSHAEYDSNGRMVEASIDFKNMGEQIRTAFTNVGEGLGWIKHNDDEIAVYEDVDMIRRRVEQEYNKKREFNMHLIAYVFGIILMWVIYFLITSDPSNDLDFPFPVIVMMGWGAGLLAHWLETFYQTGKRAAKRLTAVREELGSLYGPDWSYVPKPELRKVRKRVVEKFDKRREFITHLGVYLVINVMMWMIFALTRDSMDEIFAWPLIVNLGWGIGLAAHAVETFSFGNRERAISQAINRELSDSQASGKLKNEDRDYSAYQTQHEVPIRLNSDGEFTDSFLNELEDEYSQDRANRQ